MSTMPGNPHAKDSEVLTETIGEHWIAQEGMTDATGIASVIQANTEATLALAFEQRTANLIAELSMQALLDQQGIVLSEETVDTLNARLGLDGDDR